jgi:KaiC/GvpD/RAD55 family RecA-like ATPase
MPEITQDQLKPYQKISDAHRFVGPSSDWTQEVLEYYLHGEQIRGIKLPWPRMDKRFRLREHEMTVLAGPSGAGKSLACSQFILNAMEQGYPCLSVSLEMTVKSQLARAWRQRSLVAEPGLDEGLDFAAWAEGKLWFYNQQGSVTFNTLMAVLRYTTETYGVKFVVVDSLMTVGDIPSDAWEQQKRFVCSLANVARDLGIHIMLVCHTRKTQDASQPLSRHDVSGSSDITNRVDNVLILQRTFNKDMMKPDAKLNIVKSRHFDQGEESISLWLDMASLNYYSEGDTPRVIGNETTVSKAKGEKIPTVGEISIVKIQPKTKTSGHRVSLNGGAGGGLNAVASG